MAGKRMMIRDSYCSSQSPFYFCAFTNILVTEMVKVCFIRGCDSAEDKICIPVPQETGRRAVWFSVAHVPISSHHFYCCEDHFDLQQDAENWVWFKTAGQKLKLKPEVMPHMCLYTPSKITPRKRHGSQLTHSSKKRKKLFLDSLTKTEYDGQPTSPLNEATGRTQQLNPLPDCYEDTCEPVTASVNVEDERPKSVPSRRKYILIPRPTDDQGSSTRPSSSSPIAFPLPTSPLPRLPQPITIKTQQRMPRGSSSSSMESFSTVMSTQSSDSEIRDLEWRGMKNQSSALQQQLLKIGSRFYLGLPKQHYLLILKCSESVKIPPRNVMIVFKKIRTNAAHKRLGHDFGLSTTNISLIFSRDILKISSLLAHLIFWPSKRSSVLNTPLQFRYRFFNVEAIIDGFEIEIEKPSSPKNQSLTWSAYKKCNTIKYLISCSSRGFVNFISEGYGGRISDSMLVQKSGFLEALPNGCDVLADRGFKQVERLFSGKGCSLIRPPSVGAGEKLPPELVKWSPRISAVTIHVERVVSRIREFAMLSPHACVDYHLIPFLDHAVTVASALINLQDPIL